MDKTVKDILLDDEQLLAEVPLHRAIFLFPAALIVLGILVIEFFHPLVGGMILFLTLYPAMNAFIRYKTTRLVLTGKRVFLAFGFFNKDLIQFRMSKIESVSQEVPLLGRILGFSTVVIRGTGTGSVPLSFVKEGGAFVKAVEKELLKKEV